jgi:hypothetical protein
MIVVSNYFATKLLKTLSALIDLIPPDKSGLQRKRNLKIEAKMNLLYLTFLLNMRKPFNFLIPAGYSPSCNKILYQLLIAGGALFRIFYRYAAPQYYRHFLRCLSGGLLLPLFYF